MVRVLLTMTDIAGLAGVRRPVVSTWRRRHPGFPAPVDGGDGDRPRFDGRAVCDWLVGTGRAERDQVEPDLHLHALARADATRPPGELVAALTALLCLRHLDGRPLRGADAEDLADRAYDADPADLLLLAEVDTIPGNLGGLAGAADELIEAAWGCAPAFERVMAARARLGARDLCAGAVTGELARLVADLSGAAELAAAGAGVLLADPAAGPGDLLAAAIAACGESATPRVVAAEPDPRLARLVRRRLAVHGLPAGEADVRVGDGLAEDAADPDAVVTQLPYQPAEHRSALDVLARLDDIALRLPQGRNAVALGPAAVLSGPLPPAADADRARLLGAGVVEAVITLPGGLVPFRPAYQTAIWVLGPAYDSPLRGQVLLADVSDRPLTAALVKALVAEVVTWRRDDYRPDAHTRRLCVPTPVAGLADRPGPLAAAPEHSDRDRAVVLPATVSRLTELERALAGLVDPDTTPRPPVRAAAAASGGPAPARRTVGELVRAGRLVRIPGARLDPTHVTAGPEAGDTEPAGHPVLGGPEVAGAAPVGSRRIDRLLLAERYPRAVLTEPGDVLVTTAPGFGVIVDVDGFAVVEYPARALRVPADERADLPPRVLAALLAGSGQNGRRAAGAVRPPHRLVDWPVPLLDPELAARYDRVLVAIDQRQRLARHELAALDELSRLTAAGLAGGTLTLRPTGDTTHATA